MITYSTNGDTLNKENSNFKFRVIEKDINSSDGF